MNKRILFTGGGTAGHVIPNLALIQELQKEDWKIDYIGSKDGIEKNMIEAIQVPYHSIRCGKLRRYFSWKNFYDPFNTLMGVFQSVYWLMRLKPDVVFSKGGFVAVPVVIAAWLTRTKVIAHESDMTPGLANRLSFPFVNTICVTFEGVKRYFKHHEKVQVTGNPIRRSLFNGVRARGLTLTGFNTEKPCLLVIGGSSGARAINQVVRQALDTLTQSFQVIHLCGKGNIDPALINNSAYCQLEYAQDELPDLFACADLIVSRAGANSLYEILALEKPHILIPLPLKVSRGDQIHNARYFEKLEISSVIDEEHLTPALLLSKVEEVTQHRNETIAKIKALGIESATPKIIEIIKHI